MVVTSGGRENKASDRVKGLKTGSFDITFSIYTGSCPCIEPDTSDSTSAKSLYYMGKTLAALGDDETGALARAKAYFQSVKNNYGTTEWAAKARSEL